MKRTGSLERIWKGALRLRNLLRRGWSNSRLIALRAISTRCQGHWVISQPKGMWRANPRKKGARVAWWRKESNSVLPVFPQNFKAGMHRETCDSWLNLHLPWARVSRKAKRAATEKKALTAAELKFSFRPDGKSLKDAQTAGPGRLVVDPPDPKVGQRIITAGQFLMAFNAQSNLETLRGLKPTHIVFQPPRNAPPGSVAQESTADQLLATFDEVTHALKEVKQSGNYTFRDADRNASAQDSVYVAAAQGVTLTGRPQVWDAESRTRCERLYFDLRNGTAEGTGKVQGTHLETGDQTPDGQAPDPTNVLADRMVAQQRSQLVHYEGNVRAWRGADVVESSSLDVYRMAKRLSSGSQVLTSHLQPASYAAGTAPPLERSGRNAAPYGSCRFPGVFRRGQQSELPWSREVADRDDDHGS